MGLRVLTQIACNGENEGARVRAVELIWERGWGKAPTTHTGADGEGDIRMVIRHIVNGRDVQAQQPKVIEAKPVVQDWTGPEVDRP
jgi:hypothetical protein